jgi:hypothetical protein
LEEQLLSGYLFNHGYSRNAEQRSQEQFLNSSIHRQIVKIDEISGYSGSGESLKGGQYFVKILLTLRLLT